MNRRWIRFPLTLMMLASLLMWSPPMSTIAEANDPLATEYNLDNTWFSQTGLEEFDLVSSDEGWVLIDQHLYWTTNQGQEWKDITPINLSETAVIRTVLFLDTQNGWLIATSTDVTGTVAYILARTFDGGDTWQIAPLALFEPGDVGMFASQVRLHFLDSSIGWLMIKQATSNNFSVGALFGTTDGGQTWARLTIPIGEAVYFVTPEVGWTAGGTAGDELYRTQDGGRTWQLQNFGAQNGQSLVYSLPKFENSHTGILPVMVADGNTSRLDFYVTNDVGQSWNKATQLVIDQDISTSSLAPLAILDTQQALFIMPDTTRLAKMSDQGMTIVESQSDWTADITQLDMVSVNVGWAKYASGNCNSVQQADMLRCVSEVRLLRTEDGGNNWQEVSLPQHKTLVQTQDIILQSLLGLGRTQTFVGQGFDKCEIATLSQLQNWVTNKPL